MTETVSLDDLKPGRKPHIGVLINPYSGGNKNGLAAIRKTIAQYPRMFQRDVRKPPDVLTALAEFARRGVGMVIVNGGDGTVQAVLTALFHYRPFETFPLLAVLQSGTTSMTARDVGFSGSPVKALEKIFRWVDFEVGDPLILQRPVLQVQAPGHDTLYGMFFGTAGIYQGIQYFHRNVNTKGLKGELGPGLTISRFLWAASFRRSNFISSVPITVAVDDKPPQQIDCMVLLVSTLERLFLGLYPYWGDERAALHYTALRTRPRHLLQTLPFILRGRKSRHASAENGYFSHNAGKISLNLDSGFTLDGQLYTPENRREPTVVQSDATASFLRL
ncbi:MAG: acylglycerol kinase family protein [Desulfobacterales bacterium]